MYLGWIDVLLHFYYFLNKPYKLYVLYLHIMNWKGWGGLRKSKTPIYSFVKFQSRFAFTMQKEAMARGLLFVWEVCACCRNLWLGSQDGLFKARGPPFPEIQSPGVGQKHSGKTQLQKVGVGPSSETDTIIGQQGVSRSGGWISCLFLGAFKLRKINPFDWLCLLIWKINSEHLPVLSTAYQAAS